MDTDTLDLREPRVSFPGPFEHHDVVVNGWRVPFLDAHMPSEDRVLLVIDRRLGAEFSVDEAERVIPFVADAIAVAAGYACHPRAAAGELHAAPPVRPRRVSGLIGASASGGEPTA
jgi:hypothetical protein